MRAPAFSHTTDVMAYFKFNSATHYVSNKEPQTGLLIEKNVIQRIRMTFKGSITHHRYSNGTLVFC